MSTKVKRGLGLLVVGLLAFIADQAIVDSGPPAVVEFALLTLVALCAFAGLALIAWGLLVD